MPSTGVSRSKSVASHFGAPASDTLFGPPDRMMPTGLLRAQRLERRVERHDLGVDRQLAQATRDELRVLRAEIQDENGLMGHVGKASGLGPQGSELPLRRGIIPQHIVARVGQNVRLIAVSRVGLLPARRGRRAAHEEDSSLRSRPYCRPSKPGWSHCRFHHPPALRWMRCARTFRSRASASSPSIARQVQPSGWWTSRVPGRPWSTKAPSSLRRATNCTRSTRPPAITRGACPRPWRDGTDGVVENVLIVPRRARRGDGRSECRTASVSGSESLGGRAGRVSMAVNANGIFVSLVDRLVRVSVADGAVRWDRCAARSARQRLRCARSRLCRFNVE